jgi:uncharacterized membrane protein
MARQPQQIKKTMASAIKSRQQSSLQTTAVHQTQVFQGPTPHPEIMERYENLVPGIAKRLFDQAEEESKHRRAVELAANNANILAQQKQLAIADYQSKSVFRSDTIGQIAGLIVSLSCVFGAIYLASLEKTVVATALAAIPTAAIIKAFFTSNKKP